MRDQIETPYDQSPNTSEENSLVESLSDEDTEVVYRDADAEVVYRVEKAPEQRIWYIDSSMPPNDIKEELKRMEEFLALRRAKARDPVIVNVQLKQKVEHAPTSLPTGLNDLLL